MKIVIQNVTRRKNFDSKSCFLEKHIYSKSCFLENFISSITCVKKIFFCHEIVLFKYARKTQNVRILRGKMSQNVIFCVQKFFQNLTRRKTFISKSDPL